MDPCFYCTPTLKFTYRHCFLCSTSNGFIKFNIYYTEEFQIKFTKPNNLYSCDANLGNLIPRLFRIDEVLYGHKTKLMKSCMVTKLNVVYSQTNKETHIPIRKVSVCLRKHYTFGLMIDHYKNSSFRICFAWRPLLGDNRLPLSDCSIQK